MQKSFQTNIFSLTSPLLLLLFLLHPLLSKSQLTSTETISLFKIQKLLEHPPSLRSWNKWTNFCYLPPSSSLRIVCSNGHITELTVTGNRTVQLSGRFPSDSFFTVLTKLSSLKSLSLVSLGISGSLSPKISRLSSLQVLNFSSNFISGEIPRQIASLENLRSLSLANNLFNGSVPDLRGLLKLEELNLDNNRLGPDVPSLASNLVTVSLKNNSFESKIPEQIKALNKLQILDISSSKLTGPIPEFLFLLPSLQILSLSQNRLSGSLPSSSCSSKLKLLDVSKNLLTGKLPSCLSSKNDWNHTVIYSFNCLSGIGGPSSKYQRPISLCRNQASAVKSLSDEHKKTEEEEDTTVPLGLVIGIIVAVVTIAAALALLVLIIMRRSNATIPETVSVCSTSKLVVDSRRVPQTMRSAVIGLPPYRVFTFEDLEEATNNFGSGNLIGEQLYRGRLREGIEVVVRCIKLKQKSSPQGLAQQMEILSKLRHMHLVSVLGHCIVTYQDHYPCTGSTIFVVQEYISNGSLRDYLTDWRKKEVLKWPQRMAITIGVARGIQFLHTGVAPGIFGNNLDIDNVLLDETLTAKISGYTIPLPSKVGAESPLHGHQGRSPKSNEDAEKEDVYQFGVILLEVITGRLVASSSEMEDLKLQMEDGLREGASKLRNLIDPSVRGTYAYESLRTTVEFATDCLCEDPNKRPSIEDVVWNLQYTIQVQQGWTSSGNLGLGS